MRYWLIAIAPLVLFFALFLSNRTAPADHPQSSHKIGNIISTNMEREPSALKKVNVLANNANLVNTNIVRNDNLKRWSGLPNRIVNAGSPIIYLDPHPDDEVLTYGVNILNSLRAGRQVHVVLFAESVSSDAFYVINGRDSRGKKVYDSFLRRYNDPIKEKYQQGYLTRTEFGAARVREYEQACLALGLKPANIHFVGLENGLNPGEVSHVIQTYLKMYPHAEFRTMTKEDVHPEHALLGKVLQSFVDRHIIKPSHARYLISINTDRFDKTIRLRLGNQNDMALKKKERTEYLNYPIEGKYLWLAIDVYKKWDPSHGWFGIGYHSVPDEFNSLAKGMYTRYYLATVPISV